MDTFGHRFQLDIFGASHAPCVGVTLRGVPATLPLTEDDFTADLLRRKSGAPGTTPRIEDDRPELDDRRATDGTLMIT
ncbi:MAG: chorismate synthase, partial [Bacteroidales bacterium]|nr:chorismate synthase [Bacteroidales bacterium]